MATSSPLPARMNLLSLPTELLVEIWDLTESWTDYIRLRLVCKTIEKMISPDVFESITLYPHQDSVFHLQELSKSKHLASYVKVLVYDDKYREFLRLRLDEVDSATREAIGDGTFQAHLHRLTGPAIDYKSSTDHLELVLSLQKIFPLLPNLRTITVLEHGDTIPKFARIPTFYSRILGTTLYEHMQREQNGPFFAKDASETGSITTILFSTQFMVNRLKSLNMITNSIGWLDEETFLGDSFRCIQALASLEKLDLSYENFMLDLEYYYVRQLQTLLKQATNLSQMSLMMGSVHQNSYLFEREGSIDYGPNQETFGNLTFRCPSRGPEILDASPLEPRLTWSSKIKDLSLGGLRCDSHELEEVLKHNSKSLETLRLRDLLLMPSRLGPPSPRNCLVKLVKWLQKHLSLKEVCFAGTLTNFGMQHWIVQVCPQSKLHQEIATFIIDGGVCPLDSVEIPSDHYDFGKKDVTSGFSGPLGRKVIVGDEGWQMKYYDLDQEPNGTNWPPEIELNNEDELAQVDEVEFDLEYEDASEDVVDNESDSNTDTVPY